MAVILETPATYAAPVGYDPSTALALDSLGLPADHYDPFTPLPSRVVQAIVALSGLITGLVWLVRLTGRG